ncbi:MAG TPA: hypothetical protein VGB64_13800 [Actinomycetota bacterium]
MAESTLHAGLAGGRWQTLTLVEQLGNIGSEVGRAIRAKAQGNPERMQAALDRALELFDLTVNDERWIHRLKEVLRAREVVCDFIAGDNTYNTTGESLDAYFLPFAMAARRKT